jgi:CubicO group peptidase (beta-lactamase class C family)
MTAFIIAKYVENGKLKWTTKFFDLFPEWKPKSKPEYANITLQDLLSHQAGIQPFQGEDDPKIPDFKGTIRKKKTVRRICTYVRTYENRRTASVYLLQCRIYSGNINGRKSNW